MLIKYSEAASVNIETVSTPAHTKRSFTNNELAIQEVWQLQQGRGAMEEVRACQ